MALTVIKLLRFFVLILFFYQILYFLYHSGTVIQDSWKLWMFLISTPQKTRTFTVRLAVTTKYQENGFAAEVLHGRDHPRVVPIGLIVRGVIAFPIFGTWWDATTKVASQSVHLQASYGISNTFQQHRPPSCQLLIFDHVTVIAVLTCCCIPNFIKIGSRVRPADAHNCRMFSAPLLGNGCCHGNRIMADMSGTWWDVTTKDVSQSVYW